jgi:hypothetical protein
MSVVAMELWDVERVAKAWGMSPDWVYREAREGRLPCVRLGRNIKFVPKQLEDYVSKKSR